MELEDKLRGVTNDFQTWLISLGYYRDKDSMLWQKDGQAVDGGELLKLRKQWKENITHTASQRR